MKRYACLSSLLLLFVLPLAAQDLVYGNYDWADSTVVPASDTSEGAVILSDFVAYEFFYNPEKKNNLDMIKTFHRKVQVNTDAGIERYNKLSFGIDESNTILTIKARTTDQQGRVTNFKKDNLREVDGEDGRSLNFPIDGIKRGDVVEYIYQINESPSYWDRSYVQFDYPVNTFRFELVCPANLRYDAKPYNLALVKSDTVVEERYFLSIGGDSIPKLRDEPYMYLRAKQGRIDWKLAYNYAKGQARLFSWSEAGQLLYGNYYEFTKQELAAAKKFTKGLKLMKSEDAEQRIKEIEFKMKNQISVQRGAYNDLVEITKNKVASPRGMTRLMLAVLNELQIEHELVFTSARDNKVFDKDFDHWSFLDEFLIYFPGTKKFLSPDELNYRYPYFDGNLSATDGLFISQVTVSGVTTGLAKVKPIPTFSPEQNTDIMNIAINLNVEAETVVLDIEHALGGLNAANFVPFLALMKPDQADEICEGILKSGISDARVMMEPYEKEMTADGLDKPFWLKGKVRSDELIEVTEEKLIFNIGQVIGDQSELYQEFDRINDVENAYNRKYIRELVMTLPEGYKLLNPEALTFDVQHKRDGKVISLFTSSYVIEGNKLTVTLDEYYTEVKLPRLEFEAFKAVINAAADFNKVKLVFQQL